MRVKIFFEHLIYDYAAAVAVPFVEPPYRFLRYSSCPQSRSRSVACSGVISL